MVPRRGARQIDSSQTKSAATENIMKMNYANPNTKSTYYSFIYFTSQTGSSIKSQFEAPVLNYNH